MNLENANTLASLAALCISAAFSIVILRIRSENAQLQIKIMEEVRELVDGLQQLLNDHRVHLAGVEPRIKSLESQVDRLTDKFEETLRKR